MYYYFYSKLYTKISVTLIRLLVYARDRYHLYKFIQYICIDAIDAQWEQCFLIALVIQILSTTITEITHATNERYRTTSNNF